MTAAADHDVVVVGAGMSGLVAARDLRRSGLDVVVLETASRCGGRTLTVTSSLGSRLDLGGQWIGHDHHRFRALADDLGVARFRMHTGRMPTVVAGGRRRPALSPSVIASGALLAAIEVARRRRPPRRWATRSVADLLARIPAGPRRILEVTAAISWTADPGLVSVRTAAQMIAGQGGVPTMLATSGGAQEELLVDGTGALVDALAEELGDAIRLDTTVTGIDRLDTGVTVHDAAGSRRARAVVIALPPPVAARITHRPALPPGRRSVEDGMVMGSVYKAIAVYPTPFWRAQADGEMLVLDRPGCAVYDTSAPDGPGHLCLLVGGPEARDLDAVDPRRRRELLLGRLAGHLGSAVTSPADWHEKSWHADEAVGGGYGAMPVIGRGVDLPLDPRPVGRVHLAGSETAADHPGYIDGAIEAGERAAREVVSALER